MLWLRIPEELKHPDGIQSKLRLVWRCMWDRDHPGTYRIVETQEWPPQLAPLMRSLVREYQPFFS